METAPTSIEVFLRPTLGQSDEPSDLRSSLSPTNVYSTWQSPGGHPSNYEPGATLLSFSDKANHDERTPYPVYGNNTKDRQNLIQLIRSIERILGNISEHIIHRRHNRDQIITFIKDTKSRASCESFTLILQIYVPIRLHHVLRENNEHLITSNGRRIFFFLLKFNYK